MNYIEKFKTNYVSEKSKDKTYMKQFSSKRIIANV